MTLSWRILILVLITISLSGLANFLLTKYQQESLHIDSEKILVKTIVQSLRDALVQDVIDGNKLRVTNLLRSLESNDNPLEFLYVTSDGHEIFAHSFEQGFPRYLLNQHNASRKNEGIQLINKFQTERGLIYEYSETLIPGLDATLHIGINQSEIIRKLASNSQFILIISLAIVLLALTIAYVWGKQIVSPLYLLSQRVRRFGAGEEVNFQLVKPSSIEVAQLANAFEQAIVERQKALHSLKEREQNLAITLNSIGDAVITTDSMGNVTRMNPIAEKLTGWLIEDAKGLPLKTVFPIVDASTGKEIENPADKVMETGETVYLKNHTTLMAKNGEEYQIADSAAPIRDDDKIVGMVLVFNDVTEQYKLREAAAKNKRDLQAIMDHSPAVVYLKDKEGRYLFVNNEFEKLFGARRLDVIGKTDHDIFPKEFADELRRNDEAVFREGHALDSEEMAPVNNVLHIYASVKFPLYNESSEIYAICGISTDITERRKQDEQLRRSQKMDALGKLTGGIAHDYNNLLAIIQGYAEQLTKQLMHEPELYKYAQDIQRAAQRGAKLTKRLLVFSRQQTLEKGVVDINSLIKDQQLMLEKTLTALINLEYDLQKDLWLVELDSSELEDTIVNICINAAHAMDTGGKLTLQTKNCSLGEKEAQTLRLLPGDYTLLSISDTGSGMSNDTLDKIFDPFFTTKGNEGTGLGLSQVYGFVERENGAIKVYSELAQGSRFDIYFPRTHKTISEQSIDTSRVQHGTSGNETVLIVDDEPALVTLAKEILTSEGYKVVTASDGLEALKVLKKSKVDIVVSDVIMPNMDGYQLATEISKLYPSIRLQLVSGYSDDRHHNEADKKLSENILYKPYSSDALLEKVRTSLDEQDVKDLLVGRNIMVLDDEEDLRILYKIKLNKLGCKTLLTSSGKQAINMYEQSLKNGEVIDVVILDLSLPGGMTGQEVAKEIHELNSDAKIVVASGFSEAPEMVDYKGFGFQGALEKNFDVIEMKQVLKKVLS